MVTTTQALFAVETTIIPAPFGTRATDDLRLWMPPQQTKVEETEASTDESIEPEHSMEEAEAQSPLSPEESLEEALSAQKASMEAEFAERMEAEVSAAFEAGKESFTEEFESTVQRVSEAVHSLTQTKLMLAREYRHDAVTLALTLARAIIGHTLEVSEDALRAIVDRAIASTPSHSELVLRCNPADKERLDGILPTIRTNAGDPIDYRITETDDVDRGGILIDFSDGSIDAQPTTALQVLEEAVRGALAGPLDMADLQVNDSSDVEDE
jgi:flagellar biosynthesis/type III secretory pathway protein FliH